MEFNELILLDDWWILRHVINRPDMVGSVTLATFNSGIFSRAQVEEIARAAGYILPATVSGFISELEKGDFTNWTVTNL